MYRVVHPFFVCIVILNVSVSRGCIQSFVSLRMTQGLTLIVILNVSEESVYIMEDAPKILRFAQDDIIGAKEKG